jgi:hypothetical protein
LIALARKHQLTPDDLRAHGEGEKATPEVQARLRRASKELEARERPLIARWLKLLPK